MTETPTRTTAIVVFALVAGGVFVATPATADMHGACDTFAGQNVEEIPAGPTGYGNVELINNTDGPQLTYSAVLYCPGAVFEDLELAVHEAGSGSTIASISPDDCAATATDPCHFSNTTTLGPGTYWVNLSYDANDPDTGGLEYDDRKRAQRFEWIGQGQPVVTCPDVGYVHANPPCQAVAR